MQIGVIIQQWRQGAVLLGVALLVAGLAAPAAAAPERCLGMRATIVGGGGSERLEGTNGDDVIDGRGGADYIVGKRGDDLICGGAGWDHLEAGPGGGRMKGEGGADTLVGGRATEHLDGGGGDDTFFPSGGLGGRVNGGAGGDWLAFSDRTCPGGITVDLTDHRVAYPGCADGWSRGRWIVRSVARVDGSPGSDHLIGSRRRNQLLGQGGEDRLFGKAGNDLLHGGNGRDSGRGGPGSDRCLSLETRHSC